MRLCDSEENRRKLAWLVPGYILLAWFFCVVFQPLGLSSVPGHGNNNDYNDESLYEIINLQDDPQWIARCESGQRQIVTLGQGRASGLILRLTNQQFYKYVQFNCSMEVIAGHGMDGLTAVIEHMDLRQEETGHWGAAACPDYIDIRTETSMVRNQLCGHWDLRRDERLSVAGRRRNLVGYCYEDRSGHSCETRKILVDVAVDHNTTLSDGFPGLKKSDRHGFTIIFTAWKHAQDGECGEAEMTCPNTDGGAHAEKSHCIWQQMLCDSHQNCGFLVNKDEWGCRLGRDTAWSFGTITVLVTIWVAIVTVLMLATVFLLQWNRISFRTPLDMLAESRENRDGAGTTTREDRREASGQVMSTTTAPDPRTGGMVSIMVMYRPPGSGPAAPTPGKTTDQPPTYDSIFLGEQQGEQPPGYNMLRVDLPAQTPGDDQDITSLTQNLVDMENTISSTPNVGSVEETGDPIGNEAMSQSRGQVGNQLVELNSGDGKSNSVNEHNCQSLM